MMYVLVRDLKVTGREGGGGYKMGNCGSKLCCASSPTPPQDRAKLSVPPPPPFIFLFFLERWKLFAPHFSMAKTSSSSKLVVPPSLLQHG